MTMRSKLYDVGLGVGVSGLGDVAVGAGAAVGDRDDADDCEASVAGAAGLVGAAVPLGAPDAYFFFTSATSSPFFASTAMGLPTGTFCPSFATMLASVPLSKLSISITALSVSISAIISPTFTWSPSFLSHLTTVPSVIVSLCCGMVISTGIAFF